MHCDQTCVYNLLCLQLLVPIQLLFVMNGFCLISDQEWMIDIIGCAPVYVPDRVGRVNCDQMHVINVVIKLYGIVCHTLLTWLLSSME